MAAIRWKTKKGTTWRAKLERDHPNQGKIVPIPARMRKTCGTGTMLIPRPRDVDSLMRTVRKGRLITVGQLRKLLAARAGADQACPLCTGIFVRIVAEAAEEDRRSGKKRVTPYWRTVKDDGSLNDKFPGGAKAQAQRLTEEGFVVQSRNGNRRPRVRDFDERLVDV